MNREQCIERLLRMETFDNLPLKSSAAIRWALNEIERLQAELDVVILRGEMKRKDPDAAGKS